jgi:transglutaminase-like putative cysteine protease
VHAFDVHVPHTELGVTVSSVVETGAAAPAPPEIGWDDLDDPALRDHFIDLLAGSPYVVPEPEIDEVAGGLRAACRPAEAGRRAAGWVHDTLDYVRGATEADTTSAAARAGGQGVCQDFSHLTLALLRSAGLPARYVSGYLHPSEDAELGDTACVESHAWVEFWAGGWLPVDPSSLSEVGERHIIVGRGRDYSDVRPLTGIYAGPPAQSSDVTVELTRLR